MLVSYQILWTNIDRQIFLFGLEVEGVVAAPVVSVDVPMGGSGRIEGIDSVGPLELLVVEFRVVLRRMVATQ